MDTQPHAEARSGASRSSTESLSQHEILSALVSNAPFGIYMVDPEFRLHTVNRGAEAVFKGIEPLVGRDFAEILRIVWPEPFATEAIRRFRHTLATGESFVSPPVVEQRGNIDAIQAYDWQIHRVALPDSRFGVVCYFYDLSEQKRLEETLRRSAALHAIRTRIADALRPITDPREIQATASRLLGEHLGVDRAAFGEIRRDDELMDVFRDWTSPGTASAVGTYRLDDFGVQFTGPMRAGSRVTIADAANDPRIPRDVYETHWQRIGVRAAIVCPLFERGRFVAAILVHAHEAREWSDGDVSLVSDVAERTWTSLERARQDLALRESEAQHRALFDAVDESVCLLEQLRRRSDGRRDYRYVAMNRAMQRLFGVADFRGQSIRHTFPDEADAWAEEYGRVLNTGESIRVERGVERRGLVLDVFVTRLDDGSGRRLLVVMQDVTERKRAEVELQQSEARHALLLELTDTIRPMADPEEIQGVACRLLADSLHAERAYYVEIDEAAGLARVTRDIARGGATSLAGVHPISEFNWLISMLRRGKCHVIEDTQTSNQVSAADRPASAALHVIACAGAPLIKDGRLVGALCVTASQPRQWSEHDVTIVREVAERIWAAVERARAEAAFRRSEEQLREADRRKDEFLAMLAHELRNPLAPIRTGLELIRMAGNTPEAIERVRSMMDRQVGHMVRLTDDLLDVGRITSGKILLRRAPSLLTPLVNSAVDANRDAIAAKGLTIDVELPDGECVIDVDPTRFIQVISNLLHNATKFTDPGGAIHVRGWLRSSAAEAPDELTLSVADSGVGISPEFLPRVFDLFTQADGPSSQPGLGIGLSLARHLIEMQGGRIDVRSEGLGRGTEILIRLPVSPQPPPVAAANARSDDIVRCRAVVVDDNRDAATTLAMLVEALGGECRTAFDGETGLRLIAEMQPDVVLLDIGMPGLDGFETCRRIRRDYGHRLVVVAITGYGQPHDRQRATAAGFDAHLTKPADPERLRAVLRWRGTADDGHGDQSA